MLPLVIFQVELHTLPLGGGEGGGGGLVEFRNLFIDYKKRLCITEIFIRNVAVSHLSS